MKNTIKLILLLLVTTPSFSQTGDLTYLEIKQLGDISSEENVDEELIRKAADSYFYNSEYKEAHAYYARLFKDSAWLENKDYYRYAQCLKVLGQYEKAEELLQTFAEKEGLTFEKYGNDRYLADIHAQSDRYSLNRLKINTEGSEYPLMAYNKVLYFLSNDKGGQYDSQSDNDTYDLWEGLIDKNGKIKKERKVSQINKNLNEGGITVANEGELAFFTRNNPKTLQLEIVRGKKEDKKWIIEGPVHFCSDTYSVSKPVISKDGKRLYFVSNMPGGFGETDIYVASVMSDGSLGSPLNLGKNINTMASENFPFISEDGQLYFASSGHNTLGGYDVFVSTYNSIQEKYNKPFNVGAPINTIYDDFSFILVDNERGYFASNRGGGEGKDDMYTFLEMEPLRIDGMNKFQMLEILSSESYKTEEPIDLNCFFLLPADKKQLGKIKGDLDQINLNGDGTFNSKEPLEEGEYFLLPKNAPEKDSLLTYNRVKINDDGTFDTDDITFPGDYYVIPKNKKTQKSLPLNSNAVNLFPEGEYTSDEAIKLGYYYLIPRAPKKIAESELKRDLVNFQKDGSYTSEYPVEKGKYHMLPKNKMASNEIEIGTDGSYQTDKPIKYASYYLIPKHKMSDGVITGNANLVDLLEDNTYTSEKPIQSGNYFLIPKDETLLRNTGLSEGTALIYPNGTYNSENPKRGDYFLIPASGEQIASADLLDKIGDIKDDGTYSSDGVIPEGNYFLVGTNDELMPNGTIAPTEMDMNKDGSYTSKKPIQKGSYFLIPRNSDDGALPEGVVDFSDDGSYDSDVAIPEGDYYLVPKYKEFMDDANIDLDEVHVDADGTYLTRDRIKEGKYYFLPKESILNSDKAIMSEVMEIKNIYFDVNKYNLRPDAMSEVEYLYSYLIQYPDAKVQMTAHADQRGTAESNMILSENRAKTTASYLMKRGIPKDRIYWNAAGETSPVVSCPDGNCDEKSFSLSRRVEFILFE